jgi:hypothetical protein
MPRFYSTTASCLVALQFATESFGNPLQSAVAPARSSVSVSNSSSISNKNSTCTGCVLQAQTRSTLSYPFSVEHVTTTIHVVPYITVFPNSTVTSWSTITPNTTTSNIHNSTLSTKLTWTWSGVPLYVHLDCFYGNFSDTFENLSNHVRSLRTLGDFGRCPNFYQSPCTADM